VKRSIGPHAEHAGLSEHGWLLEGLLKATRTIWQSGNELTRFETRRQAAAAGKGFDLVSARQTNCGIIRGMNRSDTLALLTQLTLFGSRAREPAREDSDADVLAGFNGPASSARYFGVKLYLEDLLGCSVDLVTAKALRPPLRPFVERDAIHV
jgi:uncharacterized protein